MSKSATTVRAAAAVLFAGCALATHAQSIKPGLWEVSSQMKSSSGEMEKAMAEAQKQMASLPPEQRKMMQEMMARQGVQMDATGGGGMRMKLCITKEMAERSEVPAAPDGNCKHTVAPRVGNTMKMSFVCTNPPSSGEGQVTFVSDQAYSMKMTTTVNQGGRPEQMNMDASGKWLAADCGSVKPIAMPKK